MTQAINTQQATKAEMAAVLADEYGIEADPNKLNKQELIDLLVENGHPINQPTPTPIEALEPPPSTLGDSELTSKDEGASGSVGSERPKPTGYTIMIAATDSEQGEVKVAVNGVASLIKRGEEVRVKPGVVEVLRNAVQYKFEQYEENGKPQQREVRVPAYPVSILETHFD